MDNFRKNTLTLEGIERSKNIFYISLKHFFDSLMYFFLCLSQKFDLSTDYIQNLSESLSEAITYVR